MPICEICSARRGTYLPSSHAGGEAPGNQSGRSGPSGSHAADTPLVAFARRPVLVNETTAAAPGGGGGARPARMLLALQENRRRCQPAAGDARGVAAQGARAPWLTLAGGCMPRTSRRTEPWEQGERRRRRSGAVGAEVGVVGACAELPRFICLEFFRIGSERAWDSQPIRRCQPAGRQL